MTYYVVEQDLVEVIIMAHSQPSLRGGRVHTMHIQTAGLDIIRQVRACIVISGIRRISGKMGC